MLRGRLGFKPGMSAPWVGPVFASEYNVSNMRDTARFRSWARTYVWSIAIWLILAPIMAGQGKLRIPTESFGSLLWNTMTILLPAAALTPPIFAIVLRYPISRPIGSLRILGYGLGCLGYMLVATFLRWCFFPSWDSAHHRFEPHTFASLLRSASLFGNQVWDYFVTIVAAQAYAYFMRVKEQEIEHADLQRAFAESELQALKTQLHPHFLFNTLHGISALVDRDAKRAKAILLKVSALLRTALEYGATDLIPLGSELRFSDDYLSVEKMRLEERLEVRWNIQNGTRELLVPQLILQPLVENAIRHGVECSRQGGWVEIVSQRMNNRLHLQVRNSICTKRESGTGLGMQNTRARLKHLYGDDATFSFEEVAGVATATVAIPVMGTQESGDRSADEVLAQK